MAFQLKISLDNSKPPVWRRVLIPETLTFLDLHLVIQAAMGWENAHLFAFRHAGSYEPSIGIPYEDDWSDTETLDAGKIRVKKFLNKEKQKMKYEYDFGDGWQHTVLLEKITGDKIVAPRCLKGKGACPPEDCGGIWGYYELVATINDPSSPDYEDMREWLGLEKGESWDVEAFNLAECNERVTHYQEYQGFDL